MFKLHNKLAIFNKYFNLVIYAFVVWFDFVEFKINFYFKKLQNSKVNIN